MATVLLFAASSGSAQAAPFMMYGVGAESCGTWLAERKGTNWYNEGQWVLGWVSAAGNYTGHLRKSDSDALAAWVDKYCREHPLDNLTVAAGHLVDELSKPE
jgi:hypothetical protein